MRYASIPLEVLHSAAFRGAEPVDRATWMCVLAYCYEQESGGRIPGCRLWGDRRCQQILAVTKAELERCSPGLWHFDGDDLVAEHYDHAYVELVRSNSRGGAAGGSVTSEAKAAAARLNGSKGGRPPVPRGTEIKTQSEVENNPTNNPTTNPTANPNNPTKPNLDGCDGLDGLDIHTPASVSPPPSVGVGPERIPTKEENTAALERLLVRWTCATGPKATPLWAGLAMQAKVRSQQEALECIAWLIQHARAQGKTVQYASDVLGYLPAWGWHRAEQIRKARDQQRQAVPA